MWATTLMIFHSAVQAHFVWLVPVVHDGQNQVCVYFGEDATDDSSEYLARVSAIAVHRIVGRNPAEVVTLSVTPDRISTPCTEDALYVAQHDLGVMQRGDSAFRLMYYAKTGPTAGTAPLTACKTCDDLQLDVTPKFLGTQVEVSVCFGGQPASGVELLVARPGADDFSGVSNEQGVVRFDVADPGLYSLRAKYVEPVSGSVDGAAFSETRHYSTVSLRIETPASLTAASEAADVKFDDLPQPVTSFGAAVLGDGLYVYGGHTGGAHSYSESEQGRQLMKLSLTTGKWDALAPGPGRQGLALVSHGDRLYRVGGFSAMNAEGESHDLWSQTDVASFDPATGQWRELPALPERRSSHDAAVVGDCLYVVGGWSMQGEGHTTWHTTAWKMNLTMQPLYWQPIAPPPFQRRALATAAHNGRLYVIGGMNKTGGPTVATEIYDPVSDSWHTGPALVITDQAKAADASADDSASGQRDMSAGTMAGFGASAFATGGHLYATTVQGTLQRLSADGSAWEVIGQTPTDRFFHRLLPLDDRRLIVVGGANMNSGKFEAVEILQTQPGT